VKKVWGTTISTIYIYIYFNEFVVIYMSSARGSVWVKKKKVTKFDEKYSGCILQLLFQFLYKCTLSISYLLKMSIAVTKAATQVRKYDKCYVDCHVTIHTF
jgi:hypothetical protein